MFVAFIDWAMRTFNECNFGVCGKTVKSAERNVVNPYKRLAYAKKRYVIQYRISDNLLIVSNKTRTNYFYIFGGKDESSYELIQGITLAGAFMDEVALMPKSFGDQAMARCSVEGSKIWCNCNPGSPKHWFYQKFIDTTSDEYQKMMREDALKIMHRHFLLTDNPSLSERKIKQYESMYTGVFYDRYIKGLWVIAEGLIFNFDEIVNGYSEGSDSRLTGGEWYIAIDYGITNPFVAQLWNVHYHYAVCAAEYYYDPKENNDRRLTDEEHYEAVKMLAAETPIEMIVIDPSASSFVETINRHGQFAVRKADNDVIGGIGNMSSFMHKGWIKYNLQKCANTIKEFGLYRWDVDSGSDKPIKEFDHGCDASRYMVQTILKREWS